MQQRWIIKWEIATNSTSDRRKRVIPYKDMRPPTYLQGNQNGKTYGKIISSWGAYTPDNIVTNHDMAGGIQHTSHDWIVQRTGIAERRFARDPAKQPARWLSAPGKSIGHSRH